MFISVTRLHLRSLWFLPPFVRVNERTLRQLLGAQGFHSGKLRVAGPREFWTLTLWDGENSMREYRSSGAHLQAMGRLANWCDEASVAHWQQSTDTLPDWSTARARMEREGRRSRVNRPSARHTAEPWTVPPLRWNLERSVTPLLAAKQDG